MGELFAWWGQGRAGGGVAGSIDFPNLRDSEQMCN